MKRKNQKKQHINEEIFTASIIGTSLVFIIFINILRFILTIVPNKLTQKNLIRTSYVEPNLTKELQKVVDNPKAEVRILGRMQEPNAFCIGTPQIFLHQGLLKLIKNKKELVAICLHEYGHYYHHHVQKQISTSMSISFLSDLLLFSIGVVFPAFFIILPYLIILTPLSSRAITQRLLSKRSEFVADSFAKEKGYGKELASALVKIEKYTKKRLCEKYYKIPVRSKNCDIAFKDAQEKIKTHPPLRKRIEKLGQQVAKFLSAGNFDLAAKFIDNVYNKAMTQLQSSESK